MSQAAEQVMSTRDQIRSAFFAAKPKSKSITLESGFQVEIRQPTVGKQLELAETQDTKQRMIRLLIEHTYLVGTNDLVFSMEDYEGILNAPAGGDYSNMLDALTSLMTVKEAVKEAGKS
jgi:hypothetical protein